MATNLVDQHGFAVDIFFREVAYFFMPVLKIPKHF